MSNGFLGTTTKTGASLGKGSTVQCLFFDTKGIRKGSEVYICFSSEDVLVLS